MTGTNGSYASTVSRRGAVGPCPQIVKTTRRASLVAASGSDLTGSVVLYANAGGSRTVLANGHKMRIRRNGTVTGAFIKIGSKTNLTSIKFKVFRYNGATWDQVGSDSNTILAAALSVGNNTITFSSTIAGALVGDCLALEIEASGACSLGFSTTSITPANDYILSLNDADSSGAAVSWGASYTGQSPQFYALMDSPIVVIAGDSFAAGHDAWTSSWNSTASTTPALSPTATPTGVGISLYGLDSTLFASVENVGAGSTTSTDWVNTYLAARVVALSPRVCIVCIGANDVSTGVPATTTLSNILSLIQTMRANSISPVFVTPLHYQGFTTSQQSQVRALSFAIMELCEAQGVTCLNGFELHASGSNPLVRNTAFGTGNHPSAVGYSAIANVLATMLSQ